MAGLLEVESPVARIAAEPALSMQLERMVSMDHRLQRLLAMQRSGAVKTATSSTARNEVAVIARVSDLEAWHSLSEVRPGSVAGDTSRDGETIVTARIPVLRIEYVRRQPFVKSLKAAQKLRRTLAATTAETQAKPARLPAGHGTNGGKGVVTGIIDYGCDFAHQNFLDAKGKTRVEKIWDQGGTAANSPLNYGTLYGRAAINAALVKADPYTALGYGPDPSEPAHGTHVMDIAAGNGRGTKAPGMAPAADLIFVEMNDEDVPWRGTAAVGHSFGDSVRLLDAIAFIFDQAGDRPCVINISLGTNGGPHDGTTLVEQGIDRLVQQRDNRAVVIAASNSYADGIHLAGQVGTGGTFDVQWRIDGQDHTENELELWYPGGRKLTCELIRPNGENLGRIGAGEAGSIKNAQGAVTAFLTNRQGDPNNRDNVIGVWLKPGQDHGIWTLRLTGDPSSATDFHAWIERDDNGQSAFVDQSDPSHTIGSISCGNQSIVVASYDAHKAKVPLSYFSSEGPTRDGRQKPEVSAPGHAVLAAKSRSRTGVTEMSGTSMAAPATTGMIALLLAAAHKRGVKLGIAQIRKLVIDSARPNPPPAGAWHSRYGFGRISAAGAIAALIATVPAAHLPGAKKTSKRVAKRVAKTKSKSVSRRVK